MSYARACVQVRAIYRWMTACIRVGSLDDPGPQDADAVLSRGTAICEGFARLFKALADEVPSRAKICRSLVWWLIYVCVCVFVCATG